MTEYKKIKIEHGPDGWGGPIIVEPKPGKDIIASMTADGIHPTAAKIAQLTGGMAVDAFRGGAAFEQLACVIIDCGGTARIGVYPMKRIPTIDIYPTTPVGPLARFITEDFFVSGVRLEDIN